MDTDTASRFVSSLVQSIQALCHGYVQFNSSIEVIGHIYLNVDKGLKFNYIVNEEVCKEPNENMTVFHTSSYHSIPQCQLEAYQCKTCAAKSASRDATSSMITSHNDLDSNPTKSSKSKSKTGDSNVYKREYDQSVLAQNDSPEVCGVSCDATTSSTFTHRRRKKRIWSKTRPSLEEPKSKLNPVVVIKREPEVDSGESFIINSANNGEEYAMKEVTLKGEICEDTVTVKDPYPVTIHRNLEDAEIGRFACDVTAFQSENGDGGLVSLPIPSSLENALHSAQWDTSKTVKCEDSSVVPTSCKSLTGLDIQQLIYHNNFKLTANTRCHPQQMQEARQRTSARSYLYPQSSGEITRSRSRYSFMSDEERKAYHREKTRLRVAAYRLRQKTRRLQMTSQIQTEDPSLVRSDSSRHRRCEPYRYVKKEIKSLLSHFKHQIVEYAEFVGNRPAARHFGVHESTIRHWRKKFGKGGGSPRGRRRKKHMPLPHLRRGETVLATGLPT